MDLHLSFSQLNPILNPAREAVILVGSNNFDDLIAGISLCLSLEAAGKTVSVFTSQLPQTEQSTVVGLEKIRTNFGEKDLLINFDYPLEDIEKVSSQEEGNRLKLVVKVKPESQPIKSDQVKITSQDIKLDVGIVIGDETVFPNFQQAVSGGKWIWFGKEDKQKNWPQVSVVDSLSSSSEMIARVIQGLGLPMDRTIAANLFEGIKKATASFEYLSSYKTLETAALCLKVVQGNGKQGVGSQTPIEQVEKKEGDLSSGFPSPKIFRGSTTPRI